jgi:hypothetical protein
MALEMVTFSQMASATEISLQSLLRFRVEQCLIQVSNYCVCCVYYAQLSGRADLIGQYHQLSQHGQLNEFDYELSFTWHC